MTEPNIDNNNNEYDNILDNKIAVLITIISHLIKVII